MSKKHDNLTLSAKVMLRQTALLMLGDDPVIVETHGGRGDIWSAVYRDFPTGAVFEKDPGKADILAMQRPTWAVYESDVEIALAAGAARHLTVDLLDVDPYGAAWPTLQAFFGSTRPLAQRMVVVINDGLRFTACGGAAEILAPFAARYGNHNIWYVYPDKIAPELLATAAAPPVNRPSVLPPPDSFLFINPIPQLSNRIYPAFLNVFPATPQACPYTGHIVIRLQRPPLDI